MRDLIDLISLFENAPPKYEESDDSHYDALRKTGFFGAQAAGCLVVAEDTRRIMLMYRSPDVIEPFTWGNCGGAHHHNEDPSDAAVREFNEETGQPVSAITHLVPAYVFQKGDFIYRNFIAFVASEFVPDLGWEATNYGWFDIDDLPDKLHFGIIALLNDPHSAEIIRR